MERSWEGHNPGLCCPPLKLPSPGVARHHPHTKMLHPAKSRDTQREACRWVGPTVSHMWGLFRSSQAGNRKCTLAGRLDMPVTTTLAFSAAGQGIHTEKSP